MVTDIEITDLTRQHFANNCLDWIEKYKNMDMSVDSIEFYTRWQMMSHDKILLGIHDQSYNHLRYARFLKKRTRIALVL